MYLHYIKRNSKSIFKKVRNGILINFIKDDPTTYESTEINRKKELYKVQIEEFTLDNNENLVLLDNLSLGSI